MNWRKCDALGAVIGCPGCGLLQSAVDCTGTELAFCSRCRTPLLHSTGKSLAVALACASATLLLLIPALFEPFLTTSAFGATRSDILPSGTRVGRCWRSSSRFSCWCFHRCGLPP